MMRAGFILVLLALATPAWAQQANPQHTIRAIGDRLMQEINTGITCSTELITLREEIAKLKAEVEAAKKAQEPK